MTNAEILTLLRRCRIAIGGFEVRTDEEAILADDLDEAIDEMEAGDE